jgi:sideroflexin-5
MPEFTISTPEYDEANYYGRFMTFKKTCNPFNAFYSNKRITEMKQLIDDQKAREEA